MIEPRTVGDKIIELQRYGRYCYTQKFSYPDGRIEEFFLFGANTHPVIIFPLTADGYVLAIKQYRHTLLRSIFELPGGNPKKDQTEENTVISELQEETGYVAEKVMEIRHGLLFEPASVNVEYSAWLALNCRQESPVKLDSTESIQLHRVKLMDWIDMMFIMGNDALVDDKSIAVTTLAIPYLPVKERWRVALRTLFGLKNG